MVGLIRYWILVGETPIEVDIDEWAAWFGKNTKARTVGRYERDGVALSTVFLGIDHSFDWPEPSVPVLFESMVFGGEHNGACRRYRSWREARAGHLAAKRRLQTGKPPW